LWRGAVSQKALSSGSSIPHKLRPELAFSLRGVIRAIRCWRDMELYMYIFKKFYSRQKRFKYQAPGVLSQHALSVKGSDQPNSEQRATPCS
jgi:hypothetical protein